MLPEFKTSNIVPVETFKESEEATKILRLTCLAVSSIKLYLLVPILSILTLGFLLLVMFWYPRLRKVLIYREVKLDEASHVFVEGTSKELLILGFSETCRNIAA